GGGLGLAQAGGSGLGPAALRLLLGPGPLAQAGLAPGQQAAALAQGGQREERLGGALVGLLDRFGQGRAVAAGAGSAVAARLGLAGVGGGQLGIDLLEVGAVAHPCALQLGLAGAHGGQLALEQAVLLARLG